ncbi:phosphoethanolamine transferase [Neptunicella sp. SCSIO 80796]|uniref:phosphoethanolamine transferase n=1 Tax=Neptunicella plasticusilytica TaxID=3117012 RepID=UPI003A4DFDEA
MKPLTEFFNRPIHPVLLIAISSLLILALANYSFFENVNKVYPWSVYPGFMLSLALLVFSVIYLLIWLMNLIMPLKVVVSLMLLVSISASYFADTFGTVIDTVMIRNTLETNLSEATDLFTGSFVMKLFLLALLPILCLWRVKLCSLSVPYRIKHHSAAVIAAIALIAVNLVSFSDHYASFFREHKPLRYFVNPVFPIYSTVKYVASQFADHSPKSFIKSASYSDVPETDVHQELVIVVVGETARADRFSLNGYQRNTNPLLEQETNLVSYTDITACGTSTAISVPCMFAIKRQQDFDVDASKHTQNVLDLVNDAGVSVLWRDNNSDSKGVADRVSFEDFRDPQRNPVCDDECRDIGMLTGLQEYIDQQQGDILIVLHQMGSHGPAYFKRYPAEFEHFKPSCRSKELSSCSLEEINNAYDNSILYTDYFLSKVIGLLKANTPQYETSMLYISDHGESLGENGMYLHGMPRIIAPDTQLKVPILAWIGDSSDVDYSATKLVEHRANSHDAVSKAILNALEIESDVEFNDVPPLLIMKPEGWDD